MADDDDSKRNPAALGGWLSGPGTLPDGSVPGARRLDLPESGPGAAAGIGRRLGGVLLDLVAVSLISRGLLLAFPHATLTEVTSAQTAIFVLEVWLLQAVTAQSIGQRFTRTRIVSVHGGGSPGLWWLLLRVVLMVATLFLVGLVVDADGRGLQDKAAGTVVLVL